MCPILSTLSVDPIEFSIGVWSMTTGAAVTSNVTTAIEGFGPGPLPVIKPICEDLGILDTLNEQLTWNETQCNLSPAHRLLALIMNVLTEG